MASVITVEVAADCYRTPRRGEMLRHALRTADDWSLCRRIPKEHLVSDPAIIHKVPTCPVCRTRDPRIFTDK